MTEYIVHYEVDDHVYESKVFAASSASAIIWVKKLFPEVKNVYVVG